MELKKGQQHGRDERTQEDYPASAVYFYRCWVIFAFIHLCLVSELFALVYMNVVTVLMYSFSFNCIQGLSLWYLLQSFNRSSKSIYVISLISDMLVITYMYKLIVSKSRYIEYRTRGKGHGTQPQFKAWPLLLNVIEIPLASI